MKTIAEALNVSDRTVSFRDAEVLLSTVLGKPREFLHSHPETILGTAEAERYETFLQRREQNEPVAYITGVREFYGRPFKSDFRALIPRPETEGLIEQAIPFLRSRFKTFTKPCPLHLLELGTGTGNISVTLGCELAALGLPATLLAADISEEALSLASENWEALKPENRHIKFAFLPSDLFGNEAIAAQAPFDLITANLPYVSNEWKMNPAAQPDVVFHEPDVALFGGEDGLDLYRRFFADAPKFLHPQGAVMLEYGEDQTSAMQALAKAAFPNHTITTHQDYAGLDRILTILP